MFFRRVDEDVALELIHDGLAEPLFQKVDESREYLREWLGWVDQTKLVADTREFIRQSTFAHAEGTSVRCAIRTDGVVCGSVSLERISRVNDSAEIGYWLAQDHQGRGIMTRSVAEISRLAFEDLGLHRLFIRVATGNAKSFAIPERLHWTYEGTMREETPLRGQRLDMRLYSLLPSDYAIESTSSVTQHPTSR